MLLFTPHKTAALTTINSHCLAELSAKASAFNIHMRQNAYYWFAQLSSPKTARPCPKQNPKEAK